MATWSTESATKAFLQTLKMGKRGKEPSSAEFIAALAAGNNAQLMVVVCADTVGLSTVIALGAAAKETGGHAVCILPGTKELNASRNILGSTVYEEFVEFVVGDAQSLLMEEYFQDADFVLVDCRMRDLKYVMEAGQRCLSGCKRNACLVAYNALHCVNNVPQVNNSFKVHFLPIGEGLLMVSRVSSSTNSSFSKGSKNHGAQKKSRWVVKVDQFTGEEHVYRITV
ncbi:OLC1v1002225C1 [Oldenlandia corymbosa var. corymbosa]|uniref:OLC1v1002225C1 n=1 Tax=Oldenlandia corymbosa var. corymbosa TaxID=529605 RepID=A0AAV1D758_OLDCO|nr:OLC1v1002225C1 [Oldenlandia corymbosa var. corymbosa]